MLPTKASSLAGHALITDSRAVQMVMTALSWLVTKTFPEKAFVEPAEALEWLNMRFPFDRAELLNEVVRAVPAAERDPKLSTLRARYVSDGKR